MADPADIERTVKRAIAQIQGAVGIGGDVTQYSDLLIEARNTFAVSQANAQTAKRKVQQMTPHLEEFNRKYDAMKKAGVPELDKIVTLVSKIIDQPDSGPASFRDLYCESTARAPERATEAPPVRSAIVDAAPTDSRPVAATPVIPPRSDVSEVRAQLRDALPTHTPSSERYTLSPNSRKMLAGVRAGETTPAPAPREPRTARRDPITPAPAPTPAPATAVPRQTTPSLEDVPATPAPLPLARAPSATPAAPTPSVVAPRYSPAPPTAAPAPPRGLHLPPQPSWLGRPALSGTLSSDATGTRGRGAGGRAPSLATLSVAVQELSMVEDLLFVLMGIEGEYISCDERSGPDSTEYMIPAALDRSLADLVQRMLPLAKAYVTVQSYVERQSRFEHGLVCQAFCAAVRTLLREYLILLAQLEHHFRQGKLNLQKMWYFIQPTLRTMTAVETLVNEADKRRARGGSLLTLLHNSIAAMAGDQQMRDVVLFLMEKAAVPYYQMLRQWLSQGLVEDLRDEFMIVETPGLDKESLSMDYNDHYWEKRYAVRADDTPEFLRSRADIILTTGKYLNVVRECGIPVRCPHVDGFEYSRDEHVGAEVIERAHQFASRTLLDLLIKDKQLPGRLQSIKHYFLLGRGDFFVHFMDIAEEELGKEKDNVDVPRLEALLDTALRTATTVADPFKDDLKFILQPYQLVKQLLNILNVSSVPTEHRSQERERLTGMEAFTFELNVEWPLSIILSRRALTKYQLLFRQLFHCKQVERMLSATWLEHQATKNYGVQGVLRACFAVRQKMMHFVHNLQHFMMYEVIEPNWHQLMQNLEHVNNVDEVMRYHNDFLDTCLKECMLTKNDLLKIIWTLMTVCITFGEHMMRLKITPTPPDPPPRERSDGAEATTRYRQRAKQMQAMTEQIQRTVMDEPFMRSVRSFEKKFTQSLRNLMEALRLLSNSEPQLVNFFTRLDYNGFYGDTLGVA